jgi:hypothetical protein
MQAAQDPLPHRMRQRAQFPDLDVAALDPGSSAEPQPVVNIHRELVARHGTDGISCQMPRAYAGRGCCSGGARYAAARWARAEGRWARAEVRHDAGVVAFAGGFRAPFYRYWLSGFLADFGNGVRLAAFPLLAAELTRAPAAVAAVTSVQGLPWPLLGGGAGVLVDRADRRRLIVLVDTARAAVVAALAAACWPTAPGLRSST